MNPPLVLAPFPEALASLEKILQIAGEDIVRDATIHRFEYTYELAWKMIKRHFDWLGVSDTNGLSRRELFRLAAEMRLIGDAGVWFEYNQARNQTVHAYGIAVANEVYATARRFAADARLLLRELQKHPA